MITASTITDEEIVQLRAGDHSLPLLRICAEALAAERPGCTRRYHARAQCAAIIKARGGK